MFSGTRALARRYHEQCGRHFLPSTSLIQRAVAEPRFRFTPALASVRANFVAALRRLTSKEICLMRQLEGLPTSIAEVMMKVELAKAGVPVVQVLGAENEMPRFKSTYFGA